MKLRLIKRNQKGFTLIELLVAIAIAAVVGVSITVCIQQVMVQTVFSNNQLTALNQVRNVGYWINHDVVMSQPGTEYVITVDNFTTARYELLQLSKNEYPEVGKVRRFTYYFPSNTGFQDLHREDYNVTTTNKTDIVIAQYVDVANTNCIYVEPESGENFTPYISLNVTAQYNNVVKSKTFQIGFRVTA